MYGSGTGQTVPLLGGEIRTKVGECDYNETFEQEWSSYFLLLAAVKKT